MTTPQGLATFPGINQLVSASITLSHGIEPSAATLVIAAQASFPSTTGTLSFTFGDQTVELPDSKIDFSNYRRNDRGEIVQLSILDRRWKWRFGQVSGLYNQRRDDSTVQGELPGELVVDTERTPRELAELYLDAMGEVDYDVSELPNDSRPPVDHDYDNPAEALSDLCDLLGCRVVLQLDNTVKLVPVGAGAELPSTELLEAGPTVNPPELPDKIAVVCAPNVYEVDFPLEAVGLDVGEGDTIVPLDELSYRPAGGWSEVDLPYFANVTVNGSAADVTALRALAVKSVFRYYRIIVPVNVPGYDGATDGRIVRREQILPVFEQQVRTALESAASLALPAAVFGVWHPALDALSNTQSLLMPQGDFPAMAGVDGEFKSPFYCRGFTLDAARGLVIFDEPVYQNATPSLAKVTPAAAQLVLRVKCHVRDAETLALARYVRERSTGGTLGTATRYLHHDELTLTHVATYSPSNYATFPSGGADPRDVVSVATNAAEIDDQCDAYIDAALDEYEQNDPQRARVIGIRPTDLDGRICQVTYELGPAGASTTLARSSEPSTLTATYLERRRARLTRQAADTAAQSRPQTATPTILRTAARARHAR